eukprot:7386800-Prymnesium_polylepis.4
MVVDTPLMLYQATEVPPLARGAFQAALHRLQGTAVPAHARDSVGARARLACLDVPPASVGEVALDTGIDE